MFSHGIKARSLGFGRRGAFFCFVWLILRRWASIAMAQIPFAILINVSRSTLGFGDCRCGADWTRDFRLVFWAQRLIAA